MWWWCCGCGCSASDALLWMWMLRMLQMLLLLELLVLIKHVPLWMFVCISGWSQEVARQATCPPTSETSSLPFPRSSTKHGNPHIPHTCINISHTIPISYTDYMSIPCHCTVVQSQYFITKWCMRLSDQIKGMTLKKHNVPNYRTHIVCSDTHQKIFIDWRIFQLPICFVSINTNK